MLEASHFDPNAAYASVDRHQLQDFEPYIYRTRDMGKTWTKITAGLPGGVYVHVVKEDPKRRGLLVAGTERGAFVSLDDGDSWQSTLIHIAREARAFVVSPSVYQRAASYPEFVPIADGPDVLGRGGSAIFGPDGSYLAGPLWDEEGILYAELDPEMLYAEKQRFDPAGHYHRPDVFTFEVR